MSGAHVRIYRTGFWRDFFCAVVALHSLFTVASITRLVQLFFGTVSLLHVCIRIAVLHYYHTMWSFTPAWETLMIRQVTVELVRPDAEDLLRYEMYYSSGEDLTLVCS